MNIKEVKQMAEQAVIAAPAPQFIRDTLNESRKEVVQPDEDSKLLKELSGSDSWKTLKRYIRDKQKRLESMTAESVRKDSFDLQNIGFRYLIFDQVREALEDIVRQVEQPAKIAQIEKNFDEFKNE